MTRVAMRAAMVAVSVLMLTGPSLAAENWPDSFDTYVAQVRKSVSSIDVDAFLELTKNPQGALIVDVREPEEYAAGHVPGAISLPRGVLEFRIWKVLGHPNAVDMNRKIVLYCLTGGRCAMAAKSLKELGFTNAISVSMHLREWQQKNYPLVK
jgi:rhodanese-related sulfurtransferase